jgi:hypothetical protein
MSISKHLSFEKQSELGASAQQFVTSITTYHRMYLDDPVITIYYLSIWLKLGSNTN